jgi:hypothetical protein
VRDIIQELHDKVKDDLTELDVNSMYDEMLDECYDMSEVGGPFSHMLASRILQECDPVAYRCWFTDWLDGERFYEVDGEYYHGPDLERVKDEMIDELQDEIDDLQSQLDEEEPETDGWSEAYHRQQDKMTEINDLEELVVKLRKYSF